MKTSHMLMVMAFVFIFGVTGCGLPRHQVPLARILDAKVVGMPAIRTWEIGHRPDVKIGSDESSDCSFLALSGGGAFGAGFLNGWSASGTRPTFRIVTQQVFNMNTARVLPLVHRLNILIWARPR